jgi:hypothetical protein
MMELHFQPDQELEVKTVFVRFFYPPGEETEEAAQAGSSRFFEALSMTIYQLILISRRQESIRLTCAGSPRACGPDRLHADILSQWLQWSTQS